MTHVMALAQGQAPGAGSFQSLLLLIAPMLAIWYFLLIRPQRQQEAKHRAMLASLKVGDKVLTTGGIYGVVAQVGEKTLKLKVADNVKIEVARSAVSGLQAGEGAPAEPPR